MTIAVVGATGNTGRAVVKELKALGQNPVCVVRNADQAREVLGADAKVAVAELTDGPALAFCAPVGQSVICSLDEGVRALTALVSPTNSTPPSQRSRRFPAR